MQKQKQNVIGVFKLNKLLCSACDEIVCENSFGETVLANFWVANFHEPMSRPSSLPWEISKTKKSEPAVRG